MYDQSTNVLNSSQFINEDQPEQDAYKQALQNIEKLFIDRITLKWIQL